MKLRLLSAFDHQALLLFEMENKHWFESHIEPREDGFYRDDGVRKHIDECLSLYQKQAMLPMLIIGDHDEIVGRINLSDIDSHGFAHLGYRVGEPFINGGIAKSAVKQMILCASKLNVKMLLAFASVHNKASQNVLKYNGFTAITRHEKLTEVNDVRVDCIEFYRTVS